MRSSAPATISAHPDVQFVLDHLGKPPLRENYLDEWSTALTRLGGQPNVVAELSGITVEAHESIFATTAARIYSRGVFA